MSYNRITIRPPDLIAKIEFLPTEQGGRTAVGPYIEAMRAGEITAIFALNYFMAIGAIKQLHQQGIGVPETISVIGFDDIAVAPYTIPSLSSVKMPVTGMIQETISRLITMVEEGGSDALPSFSGTLISRDSLRRLTR